MITQEKFNQLELKHGCGYWNVCWEHACPCAITTENKGLDELLFNSFVREAQMVSEDVFCDDFLYEEDFEDDSEDDDFYIEDYSDEDPVYTMHGGY